MNRKKFDFRMKRELNFIKDSNRMYHRYRKYDMTILLDKNSLAKATIKSCHKNIKSGIIVKKNSIHYGTISLEGEFLKEFYNYLEKMGA